MKERLRNHLSDVGESFDYLRSDIRNLSRYMAELEDLLEGYRTFAANATFSTPADRARIARLLKKTHKILDPPPDKCAELSSTDASNDPVMGKAFRQDNPFVPPSLEASRCD
jgi:hypothetical protein